MSNPITDLDGTTGGDPPRRRGAWRTATACAVASMLVIGAACTRDVDGRGAPAEVAGASTSSSVPPADTPRHPCAVEPTGPVESTPVPGLPSDVDVTSFDGTTIRAHWFPVGDGSAPGPTVLMGPGWGLTGDTDVDAVGVLGAVNIATLHDAGYNVLTWDPRGFGASSGSAEVNSPDVEGRDVRRLLDWVAARPEAQLDATGDPAAGMVGGSYGGGIQLVTAAIDCRVDAIVPIIAWNSLITSLYKDETYKQGWAEILSGVAATADLDPMIGEANAQGRSTGVLTDEQVDWFAARGPGDSVAAITAPTMVVGGTVDTLFTLAEDIANYRLLRDAGTPVSMYWFCGGHGTCLTEKGDEDRMVRRIVDWLDRYVRRDESVDTGPRFDFLDQDGDRHVADDYPLPAGEPVVATASGRLELAAGGGSGPAEVPADKVDILSGVAGSIIPSPATRSVDVAIPVTADAMVLGPPELSITYAGTAATGERPTRLFAQLVDRATGVVVGNQITPVPVVLDGEERSVAVPMEVVAQRVGPDSDLQLQVVATTTLYGEPRLGGTVDLRSITVRLPTVTGFRAG